MRARRLLMGVVACVAGCGGDDRLAADTAEHFEASYAAMAGRLDPAAKEKLDAALLDIVLGEAHATKVERDAEIAGRGTGSGGAFASAADSIIEGMISAQLQSQRAQAVVKYASNVVDGKTAAEIFKVADEERKQSIQRAIEALEAAVTKAETALTEAQQQNAAAQEQRRQDRELLAKVTVTKSRFFYQQTAYSSDPAIAFTVTNNSGAPIRRLFFHGRVETPGRAVPWVDTDFNYSIPGGIESGESKALNLAPNRFMDHWGDVPKASAAGTLSAVEVVALKTQAVVPLEASSRRATTPSGFRRCRVKFVI